MIRPCVTAWSLHGKDFRDLLPAWIAKIGNLTVSIGTIGKILFAYIWKQSLQYDLFCSPSGVRVSWDRPEKTETF